MLDVRVHLSIRISLSPGYCISFMLIYILTASKSSIERVISSNLVRMHRTSSKKLIDMACYQLKFYELKLFISCTTVSDFITEVPFRKKSCFAYGCSVPCGEYITACLVRTYCFDSPRQTASSSLNLLLENQSKKLYAYWVSDFCFQLHFFYWI